MSDDEYVYEDDAEDYVYTEEVEAPIMKREGSYPDAYRVPDGNYSVLEYVEMKPMMEAIIREVATLLGVTSDTAQILLSHFDWNKEKLQDKYWLDTEACLRSVGITPSESGATTSNSGDTMTCSICYDSIPKAEALCLGCLHPFCR